MTELSEFLQERLKVLVWSGFYSRESVLESMNENIDMEGESLEPERLARIVDEELRLKREAEIAWPQHTDCDRLDEAFSQLEAGGIIALQNAGNTQSDGFSDCCDEYRRRGAESSGVSGFCFYTFQDLERAVAGYGVDFGFGATDGDEEPSLAVGEAIRQALTSAGLEVEWEGTTNRRPRVRQLDWKRRGPWS